MNLLDEQYTKTPFYGVKRMTAHLRQLGYQVGEKRVRRLLRQMGLDAIYQHPNTSKPNPEHQVYFTRICLEMYPSPDVIKYGVPISHTFACQKALCI